MIGSREVGITDIQLYTVLVQVIDLDRDVLLTSTCHPHLPTYSSNGTWVTKWDQPPPSSGSLAWPLSFSLRRKLVLMVKMSVYSHLYIMSNRLSIQQNHILYLIDTGASSQPSEDSSQDEGLQGIQPHIHLGQLMRPWWDRDHVQPTWWVWYAAISMQLVGVDHNNPGSRVSKRWQWLDKSVPSIPLYLHCHSYDRWQAKSCIVQFWIGGWEGGRCWGSWMWMWSLVISLRQETIHATAIECIVQVHFDTHSSTGVQSEHRSHQPQWNCWPWWVDMGKAIPHGLDSPVDQVHTSYCLQRISCSSTEVNKMRLLKPARWIQQEIHQ